MSHRKSSARAVAAALASLFALSCGGPTAPSPEPGASPPPSATAGDEALGLSGSSSAVFEEFNCRDLEEVHFRFSSPGYVEGNRVGLYARYTGVPPGEKLLRIWWDYENEPTRFQDLSLGEGEPRRDDPLRFDIELIVEHVYPPVDRPTRRLVRGELILEGKTGNCARNRIITLDVSPPPVETSSTAKDEECEGLRFCDLGDGTVRDQTTGLVWLRDADCYWVRRWAIAADIIANLGHGTCGLADGSSPGDWRLPTPAELRSLLDPRFANPMLSNARGDAQWSEGDAFERVASRFYWTSEPVSECFGELRGATMVHLGDGREQCRIVVIGFARFWPVRAP